MLSVVQNSLQRLGRDVNYSHEHIVKSVRPACSVTSIAPSRIDASIHDFVINRKDTFVKYEEIFDLILESQPVVTEADGKFQRNESFTRFHLWMDADFNKFNKILEKFFYMLNRLNDVEKFVIQLPRETMSEMGYPLNEEEYHNTSMDIDNLAWKYDCRGFGFGTLVNMQSFMARFFVDFKVAGSMVLKDIARDRFDNQIELLVFIEQSQTT